MDNGGAGIGMLVFLGILYFIPAFVAAGRAHPNTGSILALNLLLGWSVLGWVAALVWSLSAIAERPEAATRKHKRCQFCAEDILREAVVCKHCHRNVA